MLKTRSSSSLLLIAVLLWTLLLPTHAQTPAPGYLAAWGQVPGVAPVGLGNVTAIAGGQSHAVALRADGTVVAWGDDEVGQISVPAGLTDVIALAAGDFHSLALKSDGTVIAWGDNEGGQCDVPAGLAEIAAVAAGTDHSVALKADGTVVGWGESFEGSIVPADLTSVIAISAGGFHSAALKNDGTIVAWGNNDAGQTSLLPPGLKNGLAISAARGSYTMAILADVPVPIDCLVSEFGAWSDWEPISGLEEQRTRTRTILTHPANGGAACPYFTETETRLIPPAPTSCVFDFSAHVAAVIDWAGGTITLTDIAGCVKVVTR